MDNIIQRELEILIGLEHVRITAEGNYLKDPTDTDNLTNWGGALTELSGYGYRYAYQKRKILREAVSKLEEALTINPAKHEALWYLGRAHTYIALLADDYGEAKILFDEAYRCFQKAVDESPENIEYQQSLANCVRAPGLGREINGERAATSNATCSANLMYDICGWAILAGLLMWIGLVK